MSQKLGEKEWQHQIQEAYGPHLILDGYGCPAGRLADLDHIYAFLEAMPGAIGMTPIMPPYVFKYFAKTPEDWGISGFVLIAESHISIHTYPDRQFFTLDIFSCKDFDADLAKVKALTWFGAGNHNYQLLTRGLEFPRNVSLVTAHMRHERRAGENND